MKNISFAFCSAAVLGGLLLAQIPPSPPTPAQMAAHQVSFLTETLSLTSDQQKQVTTILTNASTNESSVRTGMSAAHKALETAVEANDAAGISAAATKIGEFTTQQVQAQANAHAAIYALLTPEQQTKFKNFSSHGPGGFGGRRGGPMGGPGMSPPPPEQ